VTSAAGSGRGRRALSRAFELLSRWFGSKWFLPCCIAVALVPRVAWVLAIPNRQVSDFLKYETLGREIAAGHGYSAFGRPTAYFPIGYPLLLGAIFRLFDGSELAAKLANVALYLGIIVLSFRLAEELFRSRFVAGLVATALALEPNHIAFSSILLSETSFTFFTLLGAWLLVRGRAHAGAVLLAGLVFGLASLVRPLGSALMLVVFAAVAWNERGRLGRARVAALALALVAGHLLVLGPYAIRNRVVMHTFSFVPLNGGINLLLGNNPHASGTYPTDSEVNQTVRTLVPRSDDEVEDNKALTRYAVQYILSHPFETLKRWPMKVFFLYAIEMDGIHRNLAGLPDGSWIAWLRPLTQGYYMLIVLGFLASLAWYWWRRNGAPPFPRLALLGFWIIVAWTLIHVVYLGVSRYHYPMVPWMAMYAAALLHGAWSAWSRRLASDVAPPVTT
jgi:4-amino-4-deoxy-L-arabinose transferase-like glycosyltransferase